MSPSFDPTTKLFFVTARETCAMYYAYDQKFKPGQQYTGGGQSRPRDQKNFGALRAIDPTTGLIKWEYLYTSVSGSGVLTTASGVVFAGGLYAQEDAPHGHYARLAERNLPVVFINAAASWLDFPTVSCDDAMAAEQALDHLVALGHRVPRLDAGEPLVGG